MLTNNPKILFICPLPPPVHGSSMVSQHIQESRMLNEAFDMDFVNLSTSRKMEEIGKRSLWLYVRKAVRFIGAYARTLWLLAMRRYDLCYLAITCHGAGFLKDAPFVLLCKLFGRQVVIHQHNKGMAEEVDKPVYRWLLPMVYRNTRVILLSWRLYPDIERVVKREQVMICPNGIPDSNRVGNGTEGQTEALHVLFLSNLIVSKGVLVLLDALKVLKERGCRLVCDFVGGESKELDAKRFLREVEARGLDGMAVYHGKRYGEEKERFFERADLFVFPSFYENECFPLVNLEAMCHGLPVVSTNEGAIPDEVADGVNGLIVAPRDAAALADAIERLAERKELRRQMGEAGYSRFQERFTLEAFERKMKDCLLNCIQ